MPDKWLSGPSAGPAWCAGLFVGLRAQNGPSASRDTLVYKDGDRVQGVLVQQTPFGPIIGAARIDWRD